MSIGHVRDLGNGSSSSKTFSANFEYTGEIQKYTVPKSGLYKLEVWGGQGGGYVSTTKDNGGKGGYSAGHKYLNKGTVLYIVCGGLGYTAKGGSRGIQSLNGGGASTLSTSGGGAVYLGSGGGATHIALIDGVLSNMGETSFLENGLLIAGGGGGGFYSGSSDYTGGVGGAETNLNATFGQGWNPYVAQYSVNNSPGGGGGYFGGKVNSDNRYIVYGGSSFIGNVPTVTYKGVSYSPTKTAGVNTGAGKAKITFIAG